MKAINNTLQDLKSHQDDMKRNVRHIKRATKKTNVIPSANNIVVVGANDIKSFQRDANVLWIKKVPTDTINYPEPNDPYYQGFMGVLKQDWDRINYGEALEEFGFGEYSPLLGQYEGGCNACETHEDLNISLDTIPLRHTSL